MGDEMFRLKDRHGADACLGMTHEEVFTTLATELRSLPPAAADLVPDPDEVPGRAAPEVGPVARARVRDEGFVLVRHGSSRASTARSSITSTRTAESSSAAASRRSRCRRRRARWAAANRSSSWSRPTRARTGSPRAAPAATRANVEKATSLAAGRGRSRRACAAPEKFATPGVRTIDDLARMRGRRSGRAPDQDARLRARRRDHAGVVARRPPARGPEAARRHGRARRAARARGRDPRRARRGCGQPRRGRREGRAHPRRRGAARAARDDDRRERGRLPPAQRRRRARHRGRVNGSTCALVTAGEACPLCEGKLAVRKTIEVGHIFKLGTQYSETLGASVQAEDGKNVPDRDGLLRHRRRASAGSDRRAAPRRERHHLAGERRALRGGGDRAQPEGGRDERGGRAPLRRARQARASTRSSTTATSDPA